jgi:hypothetical protein
MTDAILVVGSGNTTRANVEALMEDYFYANPDIEVRITVFDNPSDGQVWAAQYALDKEKSVKVYLVPGSRMAGFPIAVPRQESSDPLSEASQEFNNLEAFIIWNDEDSVCHDALAVLSRYGHKALDLTNGLVEIKAVGELQEQVKPELPKAEVFTPAEVAEIAAEDLKQIVLENIDEAEFEVELEDGEEEYEDPLYEAINIVAKVFAEAIAKELVKVLGK